MEQQEIENYEAHVLMTPSERRALRKWVSTCHSVYENPGSRYLCISPGDADYDYLSVYLIDHEIRCELRGKTPAERESYLRESIGWCEESEEEQSASPGNRHQPLPGTFPGVGTGTVPHMGIYQPQEPVERSLCLHR